MRASVRRTALFAIGTLVVLTLAYIPIIRVHPGWEDEVFWSSTCLSMVRHQRAVPSVLADFPGTHTPLQFYGPTLFWVGALVLKMFGATMRSWRSFTFAGSVAFLAAIAVLFRRLRGSWCAGAAAAFVFSLSIVDTFGFSLPGRTDKWTLALIVAALAVAAGEHAERLHGRADFVIRWLIVGVLTGIAASTTPRCWPILLLLFATLPLLVEERKWISQLIFGASGLLTFTFLLLPLHSTPWGHVAYVQRASSDDKVAISPLMGGYWRFGHSTTQLAYCGALLVLLCLLFLPRWREQERFVRWLLSAGLLNLAATLLLVAGAMNFPTYWSFPLEIAVLLGLMLPATTPYARVSRVLGVVLFGYLVLLRTAREAPVFAHWARRDPAQTQRVIADSIPRESLVYGPIGEYFYPAQQSGLEYRYLVERTTPGLLSVSGAYDRASPMTDACDAPAYLVWPAEDESEPLPQFPRVMMRRVAENPAPPERAGGFERMMAKVPAGRPQPAIENFIIYRLQLDSHYCATLHGTGMDETGAVR